MMNKWIFGAALLLFAACTNDELTDGTDTLPEGMYPLQISGITLEAESSEQPWGADAPQTRVSETDDRNGSVWQDGDKINVQIGDGTPGVYTYTDGKLEVADSDVPAYWASTASGQTITAWYTSLGSETVDLSNQINGLAYVLKAQTTANFNESVSLAFSHALAKIRVVLEGNADGVTDVKIKTRTSCTLNADGTLTVGSTEDFIPMVKTGYNGKNCWEANVVPGQEIQNIKVDDVAATLTQTVAPMTGKYHEITIKVNKAYNPDKLPETITEGEYVVSGTGTKTINIEGSPTVTLRNVNVNASVGPGINIKRGNPILIFEGSNALVSNQSNNGGIVLTNNASVTIEGKGSDAALEIKYAAGERQIGIGCMTGTCGDITIKNMKLTITSHRASGIGSGPNSTCGNIRIENSELDITSNENAACISASSADRRVVAQCGNITIKNCSVKGTSPDWSSFGAAAAVIGVSAGYAHCENIDIYLKPGQDLNGFLGNLSGTDGTDKVGVGSKTNPVMDNISTVGNITFYDASGKKIATGTQK